MKQIWIAACLLCLFVGSTTALAVERGTSSIQESNKLPDIAPARSWADVDAGKGFVSRPWHLRGDGQSQAVNTFWVEVKVRPLAAEQGWQAVGMHLGTQQSEDVSMMLACRDFTSIAGRRFCSNAPNVYGEGAHFVSIYGGIHAELIELATSQARPLQFYVGAGTVHVEAIALESQFAPYSTFELTYQLPNRITARAAVFVSMLDERTLSALAAPSLSILYRF